VRTIVISSRFKKDVKRTKKRGKDLDKLEEIVGLLAQDQDLPTRCRPHKLIGNYEGFWECHIEPDWLLVYGINDEENTLDLARTGTHSDLFR